MARILITGSTDGVGAITARRLISNGHSVTLHARNATRAAHAREALPNAANVLIGDLSSLAQTKALAASANASGAFDVVMHNAGIGFQEPDRGTTEDGLPKVFAVNSLAPYVLTCLMKRPKRLLYLSSGLHTRGDPEVGLSDATWTDRKWDGYQAYCDSKLQDVLLALSVARRWKNVESHALTPGWVQTKMGGMSAPGDAETGANTMVMLAEGEGLGTGKYWKDMRPAETHEAADNIEKQEQFLKLCEQLSGVTFPQS